MQWDSVVLQAAAVSSEPLRSKTTEKCNQTTVEYLDWIYLDWRKGRNKNLR
jgi:hypothetical protein